MEGVPVLIGYPSPTSLQVTTIKLKGDINKPPLQNGRIEVLNNKSESLLEIGQIMQSLAHPKLQCDEKAHPYMQQ